MDLHHTLVTQLGRAVYFEKEILTERRKANSCQLLFHILNKNLLLFSKDSRQKDKKSNFSVARCLNLF